jgi:CRP-like cAMP-binding protein
MLTAATLHSISTSAPTWFGPRGRDTSSALPILADLIDGPPGTYSAGQTVFACGVKADSIYEVVSGVVRTVHLRANGRRIICGFFVPGEIFGLESGADHPASAEAVTEARVVRYQRARLEYMTVLDRRVASQLWIWLDFCGGQAGGRQSRLSSGDAVHKLIRFLLDMGRRLRADHELDLPMTRYDIGDYLGMSSETVSRSFSALRRRGLIATRGRSVTLLQPDALKRLDRQYC